MATRNIVKMGDPILRKTSKPVTEFNDRLHQLIDDLRDTLKTQQGLGLAAVQVGILRRVAIVEIDSGEIIELVNPRLAAFSGEVTDNEGCLSVERIRGMVPRPEKVEIEYFDRTGALQKISAEGYTARAFVHELDHLDGILFVDKMTKRVTDEDDEPVATDAIKE